MKMEPELGARFAPARRKHGGTLAADVAVVARSPLVDSLLTVFGGLVAVLNEQRQIVALNHALLDELGVVDANEALGLRLGEAIRCTHCRDNAGGCGCSEFCSTCGAAIAMVACLKEGSPQERDCVVTVERDGTSDELVFQVRASRLELAGERYLLLFLQDQTLLRRQAELAHAFFHDVSNLVQALQSVCDLLPGQDAEEASRLGERTRQLVRRLGREINLQRTLLGESADDLQVRWEVQPVDRTLREVEQLFQGHPLALDRNLVRRDAPDAWTVRADHALLTRILVNMVTNGLEAARVGDVVRLWAERTPGGVRFCVHNPQAMPAAVTARVFQRHFTTKPGRGRGLGTHAMRLLGERYLGGKVDFETGPGRGTVFRLALPADTGLR